MQQAREQLSALGRTDGTVILRLLTSLHIMWSHINHGANNDIPILPFIPACGLRVCVFILFCQGHMELVQYLVSCGLDVNTQNNGGHTCFHVASESGHIDLSTWLHENGALLWM